MIFLSYVVGDVFTFTGGSGTGFIHVVAYANHVNLGFLLGAGLDDPKALLEGSGKKIRHIRIEASAELCRKPVRDGIQPRSVKVSAKARLATRAQKKKTQQKSEKKTKTAAANRPQKKVAKRATKKVRKKR